MEALETPIAAIAIDEGTEKWPGADIVTSNEIGDWLGRYCIVS